MRLRNVCCPQTRSIQTGSLRRRPAPLSSIRSVSSTTQPANARSLATRLRNITLGTGSVIFLVAGYAYVTDTRAGFHRWVAPASLRFFFDDAEEAHEAGVKALKVLYQFGLHPRERSKQDDRGDLEIEVFGHTLCNPIGTSAGIDKHAEIPSPLLALGPAIIEIGGTTPNPQDGNEKPRVFRLPSQKALINRYGLNSEGADHVAMRLRERVREFAFSLGFGMDAEGEQRVLNGEAKVPPGSLIHGKLMAVQIAKNKHTPDNDIEAVKRDYVYCVEALARYADIIVVNVSSPNTPGLRGLQKVEPLTKIMTAVVNAATQKAGRKHRPAVMVKVSPDEDSDEQIMGVCQAVWEAGVDGVIVGNTTKSRPSPLPGQKQLSTREAALISEHGGYSGPQLFEKTVSMVKRYRRMLDEGMYRHEQHPAAPSLESQSNKIREISTTEKISATVKRDNAQLKPLTGEKQDFKQQPLIRLPSRNDPQSTEEGGPEGAPAYSNSHHLDQIPSSIVAQSGPPFTQPSSLAGATPLGSLQQKVIFATGGITNGKQALEVLNAGASVAMVYTALVYGGVGTMSRIKSEMRQEIKRA